MGFGRIVWVGGPTEHEGVAAQLLVNLDFDELLEATDIESETRQFWGDLNDLSTITFHDGGVEEGHDG